MDKGQPADRRTTLAEDRTVLAAKRTFAAWLRTGLAFLASGLAVQRLLRDVPGGWEMRVVATVLIACAVASFGAGAGATPGSAPGCLKPTSACCPGL